MYMAKHRHKIVYIKYFLISTFIYYFIYITFKTKFHQLKFHTLILKLVKFDELIQIFQKVM